MPAIHTKDHPHCPNCGGVEGIYARADLRWQDATQSWEISHIEDELDCSTCDHNWSLNSSEFPAVELSAPVEREPAQ